MLNQSIHLSSDNCSQILWVQAIFPFQEDLFTCLEWVSVLFMKGLTTKEKNYKSHTRTIWSFSKSSNSWDIILVILYNSCRVISVIHDNSSHIIQCILYVQWLKVLFPVIDSFTFQQLYISFLSNPSEQLLWYSVHYCHLSAFVFIILCALTFLYHRSCGFCYPCGWKS